LGVNLYRIAQLAEAAGIEPASTVSRKERWRATSVARARFSAESVAAPSPLESPAVPWSSSQSWRRTGDGSDSPLPVSLSALQDYLEVARSRPTLPPPVAEACRSPSPRAPTGPATLSAPLSTCFSRSTSTGTSGSTRTLRAAGRIATQGGSRNRRGLPRLRPSGGRLRADPLPELPGRARHHGDPRSRPAPPRRGHDSARPARAVPARAALARPARPPGA